MTALGGIHMALIKVTSEDLATVAAQLSSGSEEIDSQLTTMRGLVQSLVASNWQGAASSAFDTLYQQWNTSAANLQEALDGISRLVANAATAYANTEQQIQQSMHT
jgi:WXG100 family type VII secretion target